MEQFKVGDRIKTIEGNKETGPFTGTIIKTGKKFKEYRAVIVRKDDADVSVRDVRVLEKNIVLHHDGVLKLHDYIISVVSFVMLVSVTVFILLSVTERKSMIQANIVKEQAAHYSAYPTTIAAIAKVRGDKFIGVAGSSEKLLALVLHHGYFKALYYYGGSWEFVAEVMNEKESISNENKY